MNAEAIQRLNHDKVYATNNRYAYLWDRYQESKSDADRRLATSEMKLMNFVPTYDKWCLQCQKRGCTMRCSGCKHVFFCSAECNQKAWSIHKNHCKRDLFTLCICCGNVLAGMKVISCVKCPVGYCSLHCMQQIATPHLQIDCAEFSRLYGKRPV